MDGQLDDHMHCELCHKVIETAGGIVDGCREYIEPATIQRPRLILGQVPTQLVQIMDDCPVHEHCKAELERKQKRLARAAQLILPQSTQPI